MKNYHLNLLQPSERLSSSPIRMRVMMPLLAFLLCLAMVVIYGVSFAQQMMVNASVKACENEIQAKTSKHTVTISQMDNLRELQSNKAQFEMYRKGVRHIGAELAKLAEVVPVKLQLTEISIIPPVRQDLSNPKNPRAPALWGPTVPTESQNFIISGRSNRETPVQALMATLEDEAFSSIMKKNPKITAENRNDRDEKLVIFEFKYMMPERNFAE